MATFKGFNTVLRDFPPFGLTDRELVKRDLLNHFHTRRGERIMQPNFGSRIQDLVFDQNVEENKLLIIEDARNIIAFDPRVSLIDIRINELEYGIILEIDIEYVPFGDTDTLRVSYLNR